MSKFLYILLGIIMGSLMVAYELAYFPIPRKQVDLYEFSTLVDDRSLDATNKWHVFLMKRAEWDMCATNEERIRDENGKFVCLRTPLEFLPINED